ncbi:MAG: hypothetical protein WA691_00380 [Thermoplasmata archaeon]
MPFRLDTIDEADEEFLSIPPQIREIFIGAFRELAVAETPVLRGQGWYTEELHQNQRIAPEGLFSLHVGRLWRGAFYRERGFLVFIGFGYRIPEFYDKLSRLRRALDERKARPANKGRR